MGTTVRIDWNESPVCYHSFIETKARYLRSRGIPALAYIDDAGYGSILHVQELWQGETAVRRSPFTWECLSRILFCFVLILVFRLLPVGHQVRSDAVEDKTVA